MSTTTRVMTGGGRGESRAEAARLYAAGRTASEVAADLHVAESTVRRWLAGQTRRAGPRQNAVADQRILDYRDKDGLAFSEIAALTGMSKTGVRMRYYQLTGRPRPDRVPAPGPSYGARTDPDDYRDRDMHLLSEIPDDDE